VPRLPGNADGNCSFRARMRGWAVECYPDGEQRGPSMTPDPRIARRSVATGKPWQANGSRWQYCVI
jgi:hypothetical protein